MRDIPPLGESPAPPLVIFRDWMKLWEVDCDELWFHFFIGEVKFILYGVLPPVSRHAACLAAAQGYTRSLPISLSIAVVCDESILICFGYLCAKPLELL